MKKYRFHTENQSVYRTLLKGRVFQFLVFMGAWNLVGYGIYRLAYRGAHEKDPDFENKPRTQQMLQMYGVNPDKSKRLRITISEQGIKTKRLDEYGEEVIKEKK